MVMNKLFFLLLSLILVYSQYQINFDDNNLKKLTIEMVNEDTIKFNIKSDQQETLSIAFFPENYDGQIENLEIITADFKNGKYELYESVSIKENALILEKEVLDNLFDTKFIFTDNSYDLTFYRKLNSEDGLDFSFPKSKEIRYFSFTGKSIENIVQCQQNAQTIFIQKNNLIREKFDSNIYPVFINSGKSLEIKLLNENTFEFSLSSKVTGKIRFWMKKTQYSELDNPDSNDVFTVNFIDEYKFELYDQSNNLIVNSQDLAKIRINSFFDFAYSKSENGKLILKFKKIIVNEYGNVVNSDLAQKFSYSIQTEDDLENEINHFSNKINGGFVIDRNYMIKKYEDFTINLKDIEISLFVENDDPNNLYISFNVPRIISSDWLISFSLKSADIKMKGFLLSENDLDFFEKSQDNKNNYISENLEKFSLQFVKFYSLPTERKLVVKSSIVSPLNKKLVHYKGTLSSKENFLIEKTVKGDFFLNSLNQITENVPYSISFDDTSIEMSMVDDKNVILLVKKSSLGKFNLAFHFRNEMNNKIEALDIIKGEFLSQSEFTLSDHYTNEYGVQSKSDVSLGGEYSLINGSYQKIDNKYTLQIVRPLNTFDKFNIVLKKGKPIYFTAFSDLNVQHYEYQNEVEGVMIITEDNKITDYENKKVKISPNDDFSLEIQIVNRNRISFHIETKSKGKYGLIFLNKKSSNSNILKSYEMNTFDENNLKLSETYFTNEFSRVHTVSPKQKSSFYNYYSKSLRNGISILDFEKKLIDDERQLEPLKNIKYVLYSTNEYDENINILKKGSIRFDRNYNLEEVTFPKIKAHINGNLFIDVAEGKSMTLSMVNDTTINFIYEMSQPGMVAFGLYPLNYTKRMVGFDVIIGLFSSKTEYKLYDQYSNGMRKPMNDKDLGGTYDFFNITYSDYKLSFMRNLNTNDIYDHPIPREKDVEYCVVFNDNPTTEFHNISSRIANEKLYISSDNRIVGAYIKVTIDFDFLHGFFMLLYWTILTTIGILAAAYFKHLKYWVWVHRLFNGGSSIATLFFGFLGLYRMGEEIPHSKTHLLHYCVAIIIVSGSMFQFIMGSITYSFSVGYADKIGLNRTLKVIHKFTAYFVGTLVIVCIATGVRLKYPFIVTLMVGVLVFLIITLFAANQIFRYYERKKYLKIRELPKREHLRYFRNDLKELKIRYVLYDNYIVDVGDFLDSHPGGKNALQDSLGQDVARFVTGTLSYNSNYIPYSHSYNTMKYIIMKRTVGLLVDDFKLCVSNENTEVVELPCKIVKVKDLAKQTYEITFSVNDPRYQFSRMLPGHSWIGKHYAVTSDSLAKTRFYSICLCLNWEIRKDHESLINNINLLEKNEKPLKINDRSKFRDNHIELYLKKYDVPNGLSKYLQENESALDLHIKGPVGLGLDLDDVLKGTYVAIGGGTGVFCFIDFVAFVLRYLTHRIASEKFGYNENRLIQSDDFTNVEKDFKLIYFSSFVDEESVVFNDICEKMQELNDRHQMNLFKFIKKVSSKDKVRWDGKYLSSILASEKENITKAFICGPPPLLEGIKKCLLDESLVPREKIHFV